GVGVWVCDEDRLAPARAELEEFQRNPADPRYAASSRAAANLRKQEEREEADYQRRQQAFREEMEDTGPPPPAPRPLTLMLAAIPWVVSLASRGPRVPLAEQSRARELMITARPPQATPFPHLPEVLEGEVWRLFTPMFIHLDWMHLLFNALALLSLAGIVE